MVVHRVHGLDDLADGFLDFLRCRYIGIADGEIIDMVRSDLSGALDPEIENLPNHGAACAHLHHFLIEH